MPKLTYFPLRGRGETIRLTLEYSGVVYDEEAPGTSMHAFCCAELIQMNDWSDYAKMKAEAGTASYPFGQVPVFEEDGVVIAQMVRLRACEKACPTYSLMLGQIAR